jgi:hypothetical protein
VPSDKRIKRYFVKIFSRTAEKLLDLQQQYHLDVFTNTAKQCEDGTYVVDGLLSAEQIVYVRTYGYAVTITADAESVAKDRFNEFARRE